MTPSSRRIVLFYHNLGANMVGLLELPSEVRLQILSECVRYVAEAPTEDETAQRVKQSLDEAPSHRYSRSNTVYSELKSGDFRWIYLVNKQIYQEACAAARSTQLIEYHLDLVLFKNGESILPNWTYISRPANVVDVLICTIRLQGVVESSNSNRSGFDGGCGGPPSIVWNFYDLMRGFFQYGTRLRGSDKIREHDYYIKKLIVDVQSPTLEEGMQWSSSSPPLREVDFRGRDLPEGTKLRLNPNTVLRFLTSYMRVLVSCGYYSGGYGSTIFEHVGQIVFRLDGQTTTTLDLDAELSPAENIQRPTGILNQAPIPSSLRHYYTVQMWLPLIKRLRSDLGLAPETQTALTGNVRGIESQDLSYYKSWNTCIGIVLNTRPETR